MKHKFSQLDNSYWSVDLSNLDLATEKFLQRHATAGVYQINGLTFFCPENIYQPHEFSSTRFMLRGLFSDINKLGKRVLEIGTGSGAVGICLASQGFDVTLTDINPIAVECTKYNAEINHINIKAIYSDLFSNINEQYDTIIFNTPLLDKAIENPLEIICCDPNGELLLRFLNEADNYLLPNGQVCINISNISNRNAILHGLKKYYDTIMYSEFYAHNNVWRWLLSAKPL